MQGTLCDCLGFPFFYMEVSEIYCNIYLPFIYFTRLLLPQDLFAAIINVKCQ